MIFCGKCGTKNGFPMSSMRTSRGACEICGGFDKIQKRLRSGGISEQNMHNYSYPTNLLPAVAEAEEAREERESV
jgi:hypothetical protein